VTYVDTSAFLALLKNDSEGAAMLAMIHAAASPFTSVVSKVETGIAYGRLIGDYSRGAQLVDQLVDRAEIEVRSLSDEVYFDVTRAYIRYGKVSQHPAGLNLGDCFSYAVARRERAKLLFAGSDFERTDLPYN
jgi:ribonuclease VapC